MQFVDRKLGLVSQPYVFLQFLSEMNPFDDFPDIEKRGAHFQTHAWYNGREAGFSITCRVRGHPLVIIVFEHRNSDALCALRWEPSQEAYLMNGPILAIHSEEIYPEGKTKWDLDHTSAPNDFEDMASWIIREFENWIVEKTEGGTTS